MNFGIPVLPIGVKPKSGWVKWHHSGIPVEDGEKREKARKDAERKGHCKTCTVLSGCYFLP